MTIYYITSFILGLIVGSFLNVCIYRIPRGESLIHPYSHCPRCKRDIRFYDNIPIISFIILRGRCRHCKEIIPWRYPIVEFINGIGYPAILWRFGFTAEAAIYFILFSTLVVISFIDLDHQIIPDLITLPGIPLGFLLASTVLPAGIKNSLIGILLGGGLLYLVAFISRGGMGGGDIKLMAMIGAFLGWKDVLLTIFVGSLLGSVVGIFLMVSKGKGRKHPVPFGPFLSLGTIVSIFWGKEIIWWYLNLRDKFQ